MYVSSLFFKSKNIDGTMRFELTHVCSEIASASDLKSH